VVDSRSTDVFVIGGGPAGLASAIAARQRGFDVTLADAAVPPIDKACGEGLMPQTIAALKTLGISLAGAPAGTFRGIRFVGPEHSVSADFPHGTGLAVRRTILHQVMVERAAELGVKLLWGARACGIEPDAVFLDDGRVRCRWIVGADGLHSRVRAWAGLDRGRERARRIALRRHFRARWSEYVEVFWGRDGQAYVTRVSDDEVGVAILTRRRPESVEAAIAEFPELASRLNGAVPASTPRGSATFGRRLRAVTRGNVALVGDASGSVDAITGEGLGLGFRQALALADALASGDLHQYSVAHRRYGRPPSFMSRALLLMDGRPWIRRRALRAFSRRPELFARLLALHAGEAAAPTSAANGLVQLGWQMLLS
jgi:flavin-dependent dehydrogenase